MAPYGVTLSQQKEMVLNSRVRIGGYLAGWARGLRDNPNLHDEARRQLIKLVTLVTGVGPCIKGGQVDPC